MGWIPAHPSSNDPPPPPSNHRRRRLSFPSTPATTTRCWKPSRSMIPSPTHGPVWKRPRAAERVAQRRMKLLRKGSTIVEVPDTGHGERSPVQLVSRPAPSPMPAWRPLGGVFSGAVHNPDARLYRTGLGLLLMAAGLVL